jgi:hypothetical protein
VGCTEKSRLLEEYGAATQRLSQAVARYGGSLGLAPVEQVQVEKIIEEARRVYGQTMAALEAHLLLHGC